MSMPVVRVSGSPSECGRSYGEQARERIHASIEAYGRIFAHYAKWDWTQVRAEAARYVDAIAAFAPAQLEEMQGIADGAGVEFADILAINVRTEIMYAAKARAFEATLPRFAECSSFAVVADDGTTYAGQNWDWGVHAFDTVLRLEVMPHDGPPYVTIVEAGLLCKFGMNGAGLALCCNALVSSEDRGEPGIPFHVMLRALITAETPVDALVTLQKGKRSSSANYLIAHRSGLAMDFECEAGDLTRIAQIPPDDRGIILHTNHFIGGGLTGTDVGLWVYPDSPFRMQRLQRAVRLADKLTPPDWFLDIAQDHAGYPNGVCCHPDPSYPLEEQGATVAGAIMNLSTGTMHIWDGYPCTAERSDRDFGEQWGTASVWMTAV